MNNYQYIIFDNFLIFKDSNAFKLQLKETLLISGDNDFWTKIFTHFPWNCLINYNIVTFIIFFAILYLLYVIFMYYYIIFTIDFIITFIIFLYPMSVNYFYCKIVIMRKLPQFDNVSSWSESLFVIHKSLWIHRKYFVFLPQQYPNLLRYLFFYCLFCVSISIWSTIFKNNFFYHYYMDLLQFLCLGLL